MGLRYPQRSGKNRTTKSNFQYLARLEEYLRPKNLINCCVETMLKTPVLLHEPLIEAMGQQNSQSHVLQCKKYGFSKTCLSIYTNRVSNKNVAIKIIFCHSTLIFMSKNIRLDHYNLQLEENDFILNLEQEKVNLILTSTVPFGKA